MDEHLKLIATYTYPHEAVFIQSALESAGIRFYIRFHTPMIKNKFYSHCERVKNIYVHENQVDKALKIMRNVNPDFHMRNRCTLIHTKEMDKFAKPEASEKGFCWTCYTLMFAALGVSVYAIIHSLQCIF